MSNRPRIYVRPLASYTRGDLYGVWIDAAQPVEGIRAAIAEMTAKGPAPKADEWGIHDSDGFGFTIGEYESLDKISVLARALVECDNREALTAWLSRCDIDDEWTVDVETLLERFGDQYLGCWGSFEDMAEDEEQDPLHFNTLATLIGEVGGSLSPQQKGAMQETVDRIREYVDWERVGRELNIAYPSQRGPDGLHVFNTNA